MGEGVVIEPREYVERVGGGVLVGEGGDCLILAGCYFPATGRYWNLTVSVTLSFLPRAVNYSFLIGLSSS